MYKYLLYYSVLILCSEKLFAQDSLSKQKLNEWSDVGDDGKFLFKLHIYQDSLYNLFIETFDKKNYVYGTAAVMFSDIDKKLTGFCNLSNGAYKEYVISTYDKGSTYGAKSNIIIWYSDNLWHVTRDNFKRAFIKDVNKDGVFEIVDYFGEKKTVYHFDNGNFILAR
ncbi:hypothetical protein ACTHGU_03615 [Chitinophagaceae bacterium MMS25-I14]